MSEWNACEGFIVYTLHYVRNDVILLMNSYKLDIDNCS